MYFKLKYVEGAVPEGERKAGAVSGGDKKESTREKSRKYEGREGEGLPREVETRQRLAPICRWCRDLQRLHFSAEMNK